MVLGIFASCDLDPGVRALCRFMFFACCFGLLVRSLRVACEPQTNAFSCQLRSPDAIRASATPFFVGGVFASTSRGLCQNDFQIALLAACPALDERRWILRQIVVELALRVRLVEFLHEQGEVVVCADD